MPYQLSEINEKIRRDPAAFLAECDAHYQEPVSYTHLTLPTN